MDIPDDHFPPLCFVRLFTDGRMRYGSFELARFSCNFSVGCPILGLNSEPIEKTIAFDLIEVTVTMSRRSTPLTLSANLSDELFHSSIQALSIWFK